MQQTINSELMHCWCSVGCWHFAWVHQLLIIVDPTPKEELMSETMETHSHRLVNTRCEPNSQAKQVVQIVFFSGNFSLTSMIGEITCLWMEPHPTDKVASYERLTHPRIPLAGFLFNYNILLTFYFVKHECHVWRLPAQALSYITYKPRRCGNLWVLFLLS